MQTVKMKVDGMTCGGCVASVTRVVKALPGVEAARVDLASGSAEVDFDPARCDAGAIRNAIEGAGYDVRA
ncbi:MAG TPA: heavy-metal-associated domain-containing protein [Casimicrobiaceae bacterium]|jgi:copper chaperone